MSRSAILPPPARPPRPRTGSGSSALYPVAPPSSSRSASIAYGSTSPLSAPLECCPGADGRPAEAMLPSVSSDAEGEGGSALAAPPFVSPLPLPPTKLSARLAVEDERSGSGGGLRCSGDEEDVAGVLLVVAAPAAEEDSFDATYGVRGIGLE